MSYPDKPSSSIMFHQENRKKPLLALICVAVLLGGGYVAYTKFFGAPAAPAMPQMPPAEVTVHEVTVEDVPLTYEYAGRTAGSREVEIRARVSGILLKRAYVEGQKVNQGDVLFEIDPAPFQAALDQAQARFDQAASDWKRAAALFKAKALSARENDQARSNYEQAKAELEAAKINLGYTTVTAPISGVTSQEGLSEGSLVTADTSLLTRLSQLDPMYVNFSAPDEEMLTQRRMVSSGEVSMPEDGMLKAEIHFGDGSVYKEEGTVNFTDSIIDPQTGTVSSRAVIPNSDDAILPGQFVRVVVKGFTKKNAIAIPDQAIMQGPQGQFVYVVSPDSKATIRPVTLGMLSGTTRLIESGLNAGDKVIIEGMIKTRPDAPVKIAENKPAETVPAAQQAAKTEAKPETNTEPAMTESDKLDNQHATDEASKADPVDDVKPEAQAEEKPEEKKE